MTDGLGRRRALAMIAAIAVGASYLLAAAGPVAAYTFTAGSCAASSTLIPFIEGANDETSYPGGDTINLKAGCTYFVSDSWGATGFALPPITSDLVIAGHGARIELMDDAAARSLFRVDPGGSLVLADVTLAQAAGGPSTGASIDSDGSATLSNVVVTHSVPYGQGGPGVLNGGKGVMAITGSTIENQGCALCVAGVLNKGSLVLSGSVLSRSSTALFNEGSASVYGSTFEDNYNSAVINAGTLDIHDSSLVDNEDRFAGGAIDNVSGSLFVEGSYFAGNDVIDEGGAIYNRAEATAEIVNSTFNANTAASPFYTCCPYGTGGAISNHNSLTVRHVTFANNASGSGASIASPEGSIGVRASIFDTSRGGPACSGGIVDNGANLVLAGETGCPSTFASGDAKLGLAKVSGFGTKTLSLGPGSAAFDAVPAAGCPAHDQRGVARPVGAACDAGAFEDRAPGTPGVPIVRVGTTPSDGTFFLDWAAATDPDGTPVGYRLYRRDADDAEFTEVATSQTAYTGLTNEAEGTVRYRVAADDGNLLSARSGESAAIVIDRTPPTAPGSSADRAPDAGDWYKDTVTVTFAGSTDPDLPDGSAGSGVAFTTAPVTVSTSGAHELSGIARDAAGNESAPATPTVNVDAEDPAISFGDCPRDVMLGSTATGSWSASDASSGIAGATDGGVPLDTATLGTRSVTATVHDLVGHAATATCDYRVVYAFTGFFNPLANPPTVTDARAGDTLAVVFALDGYQGLDVLAAGYPTSAAMSCTTLEPLAAPEATTAARPLDYVTAQGGRYRYAWVTPKSWRSSCRQLVVALADGTTHTALVRFK